MKKKFLKKIMLVFLCLFCFTSCYEKNETVKKIVKIREEEKEEKAKIEKEEKIVELEKIFFENVTLNFEKAVKENQEYITIYNEDCDIKSYYNKGFRNEDYVGRIVDDKKTQDKLLEIAKKYGFELYDAEQDHTGLVSQPRGMNYKGNFAIYKNYIFVNIKKLNYGFKKN